MSTKTTLQEGQTSRGNLDHFIGVMIYNANSEPSKQIVSIGARLVARAVEIESASEVFMREHNLLKQLNW